MTTPPGCRRRRACTIPRHEHDALRRGLRRGHEGPEVARDREPGPHRAEEPAPPRGLRLRGQHRRRRRHPHPDAPRLPRARDAAPWASPFPPPGALRGRASSSCRATRARRRRARRSSRAIVAEEGQSLLGWRDVPTDDSPIGPTARSVEPGFRQVFVGRGPARARPRRVRAQALRDPQARRARGGAPAGSPSKDTSTCRACPSHTLIYKGMLSADQIETMFPDVTDPLVESALALVHQRFSHQHLPVVAARPPVPLHRPQRRDQHPARQHQLDARARGPLPLGAARRRPPEALPHHHRGRQRLGHLRQRARVPGHGRAAPAPGRAHDDPRALGGPRVDEPRAQGLLRVPRLPDGALGRPGLDRLHRRHA